MSNTIHVNSLCDDCQNIVRDNTFPSWNNMCIKCRQLVIDAKAINVRGYVETTAIDAPAVPDFSAHPDIEAGSFVAANATDDKTVPSSESQEVNYSYSSATGPVVVEIKGLCNLIEARHKDLRGFIENRIYSVTDEFGAVNSGIRRLTELFAENDQLRDDRERAFEHLRAFPDRQKQPQGMTERAWEALVRRWCNDIGYVFDPPEIKADDDEYIIRGDKIVKNPNFKGE